MFTVKIVSSRKDVGKTLFAEKLIKKLAARGVRVVALKHIHHGKLDIDRGKDTERLFLAGSKASIGYAGNTAMILLRDPGLDYVLALARGLKPQVLVVEGFRDMAIEGMTVYVAGENDNLSCDASSVDLVTSMSLHVVKELAELGCRALPLDDAVDYVFSLALESL